MLSTLRYWAMSMRNIDCKSGWTWLSTETSTSFSNMCWSGEFFNLRDMSKTVAWLYMYIIKIKIKAKIVFTLRFQLRIHVPLMKWFLDMDLTKYFREAFLRIVRKLGKQWETIKYLDVVAACSSKTVIISLMWVPSIEKGRVEKGFNTRIHSRAGVNSFFSIQFQFQFLYVQFQFQFQFLWDEN